MVLDWSHYIEFCALGIVVLTAGLVFIGSTEYGGQKYKINSFSIILFSLLFVGAATDCLSSLIGFKNSVVAHTVVGGLSSMTEVAGITLGYCFLSFTLKISARRRSEPGASETAIVRKIKYESIGLGVFFVIFALSFMSNFTYW